MFDGKFRSIYLVYLVMAPLFYPHVHFRIYDFEHCVEVFRVVLKNRNVGSKKFVIYSILCLRFLCNSQVKSIWAEINKLIHGYLFACVFLENSSFTNLFVYFSTYMRNSYN